MPAVLGCEFQHRVTPSLLTLLYIERQQDAVHIARYLGCSVQTVYYYLRKYGIPTRPRHWHITGERSPLKGRHHADDTRKHLSMVLKGRPSHRKGQRLLTAQVEAIRRACQERRCGTGLPHRSGPSHWNWQGGVSYNNQLGRKRQVAKQWRVAVFNRDGYTCQVCHRVGGKLHAHHIKSWAHFKELRFDVANGVTLCESCHALTHGRRRFL